MNTLQFVVYDEGSDTGLDFRATVTTTVRCQEDFTIKKEQRIKGEANYTESEPESAGWTER